MKVCKKCKKHVVNKAKICKYCGSDVSKARIIKNNSNTPSKKRDFVKNVEVKSLNKDTDISNKNKFNKKANINNKKEKVFDTKINVKSSKNFNDKLDINSKKNKLLNRGLSLKNSRIFNKKVFSSNRNNNKSNVNVFVSFKRFLFGIKDKLFNIRFRKGSVSKKKVLFDRLYSCFSSFLSFCKLFGFLVKGFVFKVIKVLRLDKIVVLFTFVKNFFKKIVFSIRFVKVSNTKFSFKVLLIIVLSLVVVGTCSYFGVDAYKDRDTNDSEVVIGEKATTDKIFSMGDLITYNGVDYKVMKVRTSNGNYYKTPKEGHEFVIVTVYIKNNTGDKIPYSYVNWTMSNSMNEEKDVMFTSINTNDALYSGELVIGGIKIGSMVFEQPIKDPKLRLNFYDLMKDDNGEDVIDYSKKRFSVSIKIPEKVKEDSASSNGSSDDDVQTVKTSDENKN